MTLGSLKNTFLLPFLYFGFFSYPVISLPLQPYVHIQMYVFTHANNNRFLTNAFLVLNTCDESTKKTLLVQAREGETNANKDKDYF